ncbi:MAG: AI-2E family transporter, partial [Pseudonocardiaceae bacterium]
TGLRLVPSRHRPDARELGARVWHTLGSYTRALTAVATFDATAVGVGLWFLGVPLVLPLAVLVFLGAYIPYVGAFVSGLVAVLVGLAEGGLGTAIAVLVLIVVVQMVDGNIIQPVVMGKVVEVTAVTVIISVAIGAMLGVLGAFLAVPVAASVARTIAFVRERQAVESGETE